MWQVGGKGNGRRGPLPVLFAVLAKAGVAAMLHRLRNLVCQELGHRYRAAETKNHREKDGRQVCVLVEECKRCGGRRSRPFSVTFVDRYFDIDPRRDD